MTNIFTYFCLSEQFFREFPRKFMSWWRPYCFWRPVFLASLLLLSSLIRILLTTLLLLASLNAVAYFPISASILTLAACFPLVTGIPASAAYICIVSIISAAVDPAVAIVFL
jgi:hypothetical protein